MQLGADLHKKAPNRLKNQIKTSFYDLMEDLLADKEIDPELWGMFCPKYIVDNPLASVIHPKGDWDQEIHEFAYCRHKGQVYLISWAIHRQYLSQDKIIYVNKPEVVSEPD